MILLSLLVPQSSIGIPETEVNSSAQTEMTCLFLFLFNSHASPLSSSSAATLPFLLTITQSLSSTPSFSPLFTLVHSSSLCRQLITKIAPAPNWTGTAPVFARSTPHQRANTGRSVKAERPLSYQHMPTWTWPLQPAKKTNSSRTRRSQVWGSWFNCRGQGTSFTHPQPPIPQSNDCKMNML